MPIFAGSRYEGAQYSVVDERNGEHKKCLHLRIPSPAYSETQHEVKPGEALDFLSFRLGGQARKWWRVAEANDLFWPLGLSSGTRLDMPL
jgi:hypothetical protein